MTSPLNDKSHLLRFGYAPGNYWFHCRDCGNKRAEGDKRSTRCEACAETLYSQVTSVEAVSDKHRSTPMTIPDEAVQAAASAVEFPIRGMNGLRLALTAALPFLTGVKVKALEWVAHKGDQHCKIAWTCEGIGGWYAIEHLHEGHFDMWTPNNPDGGRFSTLESAKSAAQADYEARILSAIELLGNSEQLKPSPRAQALTEKLVKQAMHEAWNDICYDTGCHPLDIHRVKRGELMFIPDHWASATYERLRALSSQPVADGWLPIETAPKDGSEFLAYQGGRYFNCWCIAGCWTDDAESDPFPTHWRPLPSVPGNSERCRDCDGYNCDDGCAYPDRTRVQTLEEVIIELKEAERKIFSWSGSSFVANELEGAEDADCKSELYSDLCKLGNVMSWLQTQVIALSQPVADGECEVDYEVICNGDFVAGSSDLADAKHYAAVYAQDGPVEIIEARTYRRPLPASPEVAG